jgi:SPX domain protein involved in polyphosphate accumulation
MVVRKEKEHWDLAKWEKKEIEKFLEEMNEEQIDRTYGFIISKFGFKPSGN